MAILPSRQTHEYDQAYQFSSIQQTLNSQVGTSKLFNTVGDAVTERQKANTNGADSMSNLASADTPRRGASIAEP